MMETSAVAEAVSVSAVAVVVSAVAAVVSVESVSVLLYWDWVCFAEVLEPVVQMQLPGNFALLAELSEHLSAAVSVCLTALLDLAWQGS